MRESPARALLGLLVPLAVAAQSARDVEPLALRFAAMTAVTGYEQAMADSLAALLPGAARDRAGNVIVTLGRGTPKRLVTCALDEPGYVIGALRDDGHATLRRLSGRVAYPLYDQQLEGHRITVFGARGPVPGVVGVRSVHLTRGRPADQSPFTVDDAVVDLGAASRAELEALGVRVLAPVTLAKRPHRYGDRLVAAPAAGRRAACAALAAAARTALRPRGTVVVAFLVQTRYGANAGRGSVETFLGPFAEAKEAELAARHADTAVETVSLTDAETLYRELVAWIGGGR